jgi:heptosyltransferase-1
MPAAAPRVLIVRLGAMGDILHALPAVAAIRTEMPDALIGWAVERRWRELLCAPDAELCGARNEGRPLVDVLHLADTRGWRKRLFAAQTRREFIAFRRGLYEGHYSAAVDLQGSIKSAVVARIAGTAGLFGFRNPREGVAATLYYTTAPVNAAHVIAQDAELVSFWLRSAGHDGECALPSGAGVLPRHAASEQRIASLLESSGVAGAPFAILTPGAGWAAKQWPAERYGELARRLAQRGLRSVVNYGPGEAALAEQVVASSQEAAVALCSSISELVALTRRAALFVGGDTGPMHLAALLGTKTLALFGPTDPLRNGPYWPGTRTLRDAASVTNYSHRSTEDAGLRSLSVERVMDEVSALLD